ncbi:TRAP transporter small permease [Roseibium algae]|uniref:TRAP transporter small permease protein n=1 Tax=Roseibium algae TaxID=3123038 RepID=A0ABU8TGJ6_9HYPH
MSVWSSLWPEQGGGIAPLQVWFERLSRVSAAAGGAVIFGVALTVAVSVVMRNVGLRGVRGDFELVEMSCAFAAGFFLPLCQLNKGHVMVDLFTGWLPVEANRQIDAFWTLLFAVGWLLLSYFTLHGLFEIKDYGDRTMLLSLPLWWAFVPAVVGTALSGLIAIAQVFLLRGLASTSVGR